jgi:hypothetical protein
MLFELRFFFPSMKEIAHYYVILLYNLHLGLQHYEISTSICIFGTNILIRFLLTSYLRITQR